METTPKLLETPEAFVENVYALMQTMLSSRIGTDTALAFIDAHIQASASSVTEALRDLSDQDSLISEQEHEEEIAPELSLMTSLTGEFTTFGIEDKLRAMGLLRNMSLEGVLPNHLNEFLLFMIHALEPTNEIEHLDDLEKAKEQEVRKDFPMAARYLDLLERAGRLTPEEREELGRLTIHTETDDALENLNERITVAVKNDLIERLTAIISKPFRGDVAEA